MSAPRPRRGRPITVPTDLVDADFGNVRIEAPDEASVATLAASLLADGLAQPPTLRPHPERPGRYQLVVGHRRLAAIRLNGWTEFEAELREDLDERAGVRLQFVENFEREDLSPLEKARGMRAIVESGTPRKELARELGVAPSTVTRTLSLLDLPPAAQTWLHRGRLAESAAEVLARRLKGRPEAQADFASRAVKEGLDVRTLESYVAEWLAAEASAGSPPADPVEERRYLALPPTPTTVLKLKPGLLPEEGDEGSASEAQRLFSERIGLYAKLCAFNDRELRKGALGLPAPVTPEAAARVMDHVFGLPDAEVAALSMRLNRRFIEAGHRARRVPPAFAEEHMEAGVSDPEVRAVLDGWEEEAS